MDDWRDKSFHDPLKKHGLMQFWMGLGDNTECKIGDSW